MRFVSQGTVRAYRLAKRHLNMTAVFTVAAAELTLWAAYRPGDASTR